MEGPKLFEKTQIKSLSAQKKSIQSCPVLYPTLAQFADFLTFVRQAEQKYWNDFGMVKIVAPEGWKPPSDYRQYFTDKKSHLQRAELKVKNKIGYYHARRQGKQSMNLNQYMEKMRSNDQVAEKLTNEQVQAKFWASLESEPSFKVSDIKIGLTNDTVESWNLKTADVQKARLGDEKRQAVQGHYLKVGSWMSVFDWHQIKVSTIHFLHQGKSKFWYSIPPDQFHLFESVTRRYHNNEMEYLLINPQALQQDSSIRISKMEQKPNEFMLVFGGAYHEGFNFGLNISETFYCETFLGKIRPNKHSYRSYQSLRSIRH